MFSYKQFLFSLKTEKIDSIFSDLCYTCKQIGYFQIL